MKNLNKGIVPISTVLIIVFVLILGGAVWSQQSQKNQSEICNLSKGAGDVIVSGKVNFPAGVKNSANYKIVAADKEYKIYPKGNFCALAPEGKASLITVASDNDKDFPLFFAAVSGKDANIIIDSKSTAVGLLFATPFFTQNDPAKAAEIVKNIENNPKIQDLAKVIEVNFNKENLFYDSVYQEAFKASLDSLRKDY